MAVKRVLRSVNKRLRDAFPLLYISLVQRPRAHLRYRTERLAMQGRYPSHSAHPSVVLFTAHKCASVYVGRVLSALAADAALTHVNYEGYFASTDVSKYELFHDTGFQQSAFRTHGCFYGAFRWYHPIPDFQDYRVVLLLRDPRDVLTSYYYSMAHSHQIMSRGVLMRRMAARQMTVDEYVLSIRDWLHGVYQTYCDQLLDLPNVLFTRYEDMVLDFGGWLHVVSRHLALDANRPLLQSLIAESSFEVAVEDVQAHKRQIKPGEHRRKLTADTQAILTTDFLPILTKLGYAGSSEVTSEAEA